MRSALAFAIAALAGACSLFVDTKNLDGESAPDASASTTDATTDVTPNGDAGTPDAAGDAPSDGAPNPGCDSLVVDSFDVGALGAQWSSINGAAALDSSDFVSPPNALALTISADPSSTAYLRKAFARSKTLCCDFAFRAPIVSGAESTRLVRFMGQGGNHELLVRALPGVIEVRENYSSSVPSEQFNRAAGDFAPLDAWRRLRLRATLPPGAGLGTLVVTLDGVDIIHSDLGGPAVDLDFDEVRLGSDYSQGTPTRVLRYDDVRCGVN